MTIRINEKICHGCLGQKESFCEKVCPGYLISRQKKAQIERKQDCWDCAACVKACPVNAISMVLPEEVGGGYGKLCAEISEDKIVWMLDIDGKDKKQIKINR